MTFRLAELPWLPPPPAAFTTRRRAIETLDAAAAGEEIRTLASFALNATQAGGLGRALDAVRRRDGGVAGLSPMKLAVLAGSTFDLLADQFSAACARHGVALERVEAGYDQVESAALDPASAVNRARCDFALIAVDHRWLRLGDLALDDPARRVDAAVGHLEAVARALAQHGGAAPIFCTIPTPPQTLFGSFDVMVEGSPAWAIAAVNRRVVDLARSMSGTMLDVAGLAARIGGDAWFDPVGWFGAKLAFSPACDPAYADALGRLLGALRGRARKALVLDLDNTLWGGVVGDDGVDALRLGPGDPEGEAFAAVQRYALDLHDRGVFLAIASKNDEAVARHAFETHTGMILRPEHVAVFQANWTDKPHNLRAIALALNIGVDALVFLDDNPAERAQVRAALPEVAVPELPSDPAGYVRALSAAGYFEAAAFSDADPARAKGQKAQAARAEVQAGARDLGDYLSDLKMTLELKSFDEAGRARIAQLVNKTNQFNLTTRRRSEAEVAALEADPGVVTWQARLSDRFGDMGMIAVLIAREAEHAGEPALEIDTWLISCRVLGRRVEDAMFAALMDAAARRGARWITGTYRPTAKNAPVRDLLPRLGLAGTGASQDAIGYAARLDELARATPPIQVRIG